MLLGLGHESVHVTDTDLRGRDDGDLLRSLDRVGCDWLVTLDLHRQPEVWPAVYTALAEGRGRLLRIRPRRTPPAGNRAELIAKLTRYLVEDYAGWSRWLPERSIRLIDLGSGSTSRRGSRVGSGPRAHSALTRSEVAGLMQQQLRYGGGPLLNTAQRSRRGRRGDAPG